MPEFTRLFPQGGHSQLSVWLGYLKTQQGWEGAGCGRGWERRLLGDPDDVSRVIREGCSWGHLSPKEEPRVVCGSRGASGRARVRNLLGEDQKDAWLANPERPGFPGTQAGVFAGPGGMAA